MGKNRVCAIGEDVIVRKMLGSIGKARRQQEFFDGKVGKLDDWRTVDIEDRDQTGTSRKHSLMCILGAPVRVVFFSGVMSNCKYFCELFNAKRSKGDCDALQ